MSNLNMKRISQLKPIQTLPDEYNNASKIKLVRQGKNLRSLQVSYTDFPNHNKPETTLDTE